MLVTRLRIAHLMLLPALAASVPCARAGDDGSVVSENGITKSEKFKLKLEVKGNVRTSKGEQVKLKFPFPPEFIPEGEDGVYERTVDKGTSAEISNVAIIGEADLTPHIKGKVEIHVIDLYNRNPTSSDDVVALREAWILFGKKQETLKKIPGTTFYAQFGKLPRFSKQLDRHLESYGLWGTAVGRFEEIGLELGGTFGKHVYWRGLVSDGNPLFFRDPNALAGDNGTPERLPPDPDPVFQSGFPFLYDAKAQDVNFDGNYMKGAGLGFRWNFGEDDKDGVDALAWYYQRKLADRAKIRGTFYEGDLELLLGNGIPLPVDGNDKIEYGVNVTSKWRGLHTYGQYVIQEIAGLDREGYELEVGYRFPLNGVFVSGDEPVLNWIEPVVRYSSINDQFTMPSNFVAPSVGWDWRKLDLGARLNIIRGMDLTVEYAKHDMILKTKTLHPNEGLLTLRATF